MKLRILSERDLQVVQQAIKRINNRPVNTPGRPVVSVDSVYIDNSSSPEIYVALAPEGGVPGAGFVGTANDPPFDVSSAPCQVYRIDTDDGILVAVDGLTPNVYNLSTQDIPEDSWILTSRDKFGYWIAIAVVTSKPGSLAGDGQCRLAKLQPNDCVVIHTFDSVDGEIDYYLTWDGNSWTSTDPYLYLGGSGFFDFYYQSGQFHLKLNNLELLDCGDGCFTGSWVTGHGSLETGTGTPESLPCNGTVFTVCVECRCCPIPGWSGDGWYCVSIDTGTDNASCFTIQFLEGDECDSPYTICSGPYDTYAQAAAICGSDTGTGTGTGGTILVDCCANPLPDVLYLHVTGGTCATSIPLTWNGTAWHKASSPLGSCTSVASIRLICTAGLNWNLSMTSEVVYSQNATSVTCSPFSASFPDGNEFDSCCGGPAVTIIVNTTP